MVCERHLMVKGLYLAPKLITGLRGEFSSENESLEGSVIVERRHLCKKASKQTLAQRVTFRQCEAHDPRRRKTTMSIHRRLPTAPLNQHVAWLWYYVDLFPDHEREHVLPDGTFELMINLESRPRKLFDRISPARHQSFRRGWISGAHKEYLVIDALQASTMIGAHFKPGGATALLGLPASELTGRVVELDALWGEGIWEWRDRLLATTGPQRKLALFEQLLTERLAQASPKPSKDRQVSWALTRLMRVPEVPSIRTLTQELGMSHKHFIQQFRGQVGLTPKLFCRIQRFQQVLVELQSGKTVNWADIACGCGYFDQAHFVNDFVAFAGINPSTYLQQHLEGEPNFVRADA